MMRSLLALLLVGCAADPIPIPHYSQAADVAPVSYVHYEASPSPIERALPPPLVTPDPVDAKLDAAIDARAHVNAAARSTPPSHVVECNATYSERLAQFKIEVARVPSMRSTIAAKCAALVPHCAVSGNATACAGVTGADQFFYENTCVPISMAPDSIVVDQAGECDDVDAEPLRMPLSADAAALEHVRKMRLVP